MISESSFNLLAYPDGPIDVPIDDDVPFIPANAMALRKREEDEPGCNCENAGRGCSHMPPSTADNRPRSTPAPGVRDPGEISLNKFHDDALNKVGFGRFQYMVIFTCGMCVGAHIGDMCAFFLILPSAEMEFCLTPYQVNLLIVLTFLGAAFGSLIFGAIVEIHDRKYVLIACTGWMVLFALMSGLMPNFGLFVIIRSLTSICGGGIFPIAVVYMGEFIPGVFRARSFASFIVLAGVGGIVAAIEFNRLLPKDEEGVLLEEKVLFRSWRHYVVYMNITSLLPALAVLTLPESPLRLLCSGRQLVALKAYARMYNVNHLQHRLTVPDLQVPTNLGNGFGATPPGRLNIVIHNIIQSIYGLGSLLRPPYLKATCILTATWFGAMFITFGHIYYVLRMDRINYERNFISKTTSNYTYENITFERSIINEEFSYSRFFNCTFDQTLISYVQFKNCTFIDTNFYGVRTANTKFANSFLHNVKFINTDITEEDLIDCDRINTEFYSMRRGCDREFDFSLFNEVGYMHAHLGLALPLIPISIWASWKMHIYGHIRITTIALSQATMLCFLVGVSFGHLVYWVVGIVQALLLAALIGVTVQTFNFYNTLQRCTAFGIFFFFANVGGLVGIWVYSMIPSDDTNIVTVLSIAVLSTPTVLSTLLHDNSLAL